MPLASCVPIPTTVILDHHDSYTRNLLVLFSQLFSAPPPQPRVGASAGIATIDVGARHVQDQDRQGDGTLPARRWLEKGWQQRVVVINVDDITWYVRLINLERFVSTILPHASCIILGPGPGNPSRTSDFSWSERLIKNFGHRLPILGMCLGHQGLATSFGGKVGRAREPRHGQISMIRLPTSNTHVAPIDPLFAGIPSTFEAVQFNSLVVSPQELPDELQVIAWTDNGGRDEIMALRHRSKPLWGVQFHPESICSTHGSTILSNFLSLASAHHAEHGNPSPTLPLPLDVRALTTSYKRGLPNVIPDVPAEPPSYRAWRWEQRTIELDNASERTPQEVFEGLVKGVNDLGEVWLDSARPTGLPQFSYVFVPQTTWTHTRPANTILVRHDSSDESLSYQLEGPHTLFSTLGTAQATLKRHTRRLNPELPSFPVGFVGYFGYEMKEVSLPLSTSAATVQAERTDAEFAFASRLLTFAHETGKWYATALVRLDGSSTVGNDASKTGLEADLGIDEPGYKTWMATVRAFFAQPRSSTSTLPMASGTTVLPTLVPDQDRESYISSIEQAKEYITAGESYELCQTTQFRTTVDPTLASDPYPLYLSLRSSNPAPYSSYLRLPRSKLSLLSSSPERFMRITSDGHVEMKPIKGTVKRCLDNEAEDQRRKESLEKDEKERAENLMIVDLCRNDLLAFCEVQSVSVPKLMKVETYQTVHHVVGQLTPAVNPFEAVQRAFPPGSMTGAPKLRSLKLLEDLEGHRARGVYSGVFGYVAVDGTTDFSVVIRTLVFNDTQLTLGAGGAITYLSDAAKEWDEVLTKKEAVMKCFT
ncbi:BZ3500_MvSof-1268-A1-R1_Chr5-2g07728 [Microbotryum saponariae]|uniref:aminodeoxychorismate synthase n=1 Tax=Microbotryum saponariae TaxID=289078 RepID=A0A2X0KHW5_9BASI|nr:BZ3500_MvSof-1268-A1-R1_Chr5-2g07728 [Microbotryum saponariae]SDA05597.1 BZ3501_MvSof-1269-A2-R1_Chr5-2g07550 [Microbotryum saponariae]